MPAELEPKVEKMIRWMCGVSLKQRQPSTGLRRRLVELIGDLMRISKRKWHGSRLCECVRLVVEETALVGR